MIRSKEWMFAMKKRAEILGVIILITMVAAGCASFQNHMADIGSQQGVARVTGTVIYRIRMILPTDALVRVDLVDISRQGAPALIIGLQEIETGGRQVPIPFEIVYRPANIDPTRTYAVQARILQGGRLLFANTTTYKVINNGVVSNIEIVVEQMPGG
jgi:putative lipoprotein